MDFGFNILNHHSVSIVNAVSLVNLKFHQFCVSNEIKFHHYRKWLLIQPVCNISCNKVSVNRQIGKLYALKLMVLDCRPTKKQEFI